MSRIGKKPVAIPAGVTVDVGDVAVKVKGPKGELSAALVDRVSVKLADAQIIVERVNEAKQSRANHGLMRALIQNMVTGVTAGFEKKLAVSGVGYRVTLKGDKLELNLGYSHPIQFDIPKGISIEVDRQNNISVRGIDKQHVGQVAATIRSFRKPDRYKGKGIRYADERIQLKAGKTA